ncbi:protein adenylyltransferase SelO [Roseibium sediminicola]|uniref:Protein nucleotidyltransferase YdiU n=1 Tax=Roseibium sediminicola TaxID=2933272 RepID=A0ABT0GP25_9HYPH|nr:YdiU family protein [Roseibium sp. CAU 1639]MCK7611168.1 YdiU family protein [Roseibium sp. CAU 1639]
MTANPPLFQFDNTYARDLPGFYVAWEGAKVPSPELILFNAALAEELGLEAASFETPEGAEIFAGIRQPDGASPLAQVYAGHQFGGFSPQLGDGRALLIGEVLDRTGRRRDIQLKGSGPTPFSRGGDGKAVVGPVLREYILGEAMHALGIPTTRALAAVATGETIYREGPKPGAVLTRVAASHLRIGTFQYFAARGETDKLRQLADYAIARHDPDLAGAQDRHLKLFRSVIERQAALVANWLLVGFVHGVMNTDNSTISGETIDYGPCAFIDAYDPAAVFSSIDHGGRYAFGRQPVILQWNLARLAEALLPLIEPDDLDKAVELASAELGRFPDLYRAHWLGGMRAKLGLETAEEDDQALFEELLTLMHQQATDYTLCFRRLGDAVTGATDRLRDLFVDPTAIDGWLVRWRQRLEREGRANEDVKSGMDAVNPLYIPRNHKVEETLQAAETGDYAPVKALLEVLSSPFEEQPGRELYAEPAPDSFGPYRTFCGT